MRKQDEKGIVGFTLIELLVVITVIAILASLLLPVLTKVKEVAKQAECANKLKQLGTVWSYYTNDYGDYMPKCFENIETGDQSLYVTWIELFFPYLDITPGALPHPPGLYYCRVPGEPFWCSSISSKDNLTVNGKMFIYDPHPAYGMYMFGAGGHAPSGYKALRKTTQLRKPSEQILMGDARYYDPLTNPKCLGTVYFYCRLSAYPGLDFRHTNKINALFPDGHTMPTTMTQMMPVTGDGSTTSNTGPWFQD